MNFLSVDLKKIVLGTMSIVFLSTMSIAQSKLEVKKDSWKKLTSVEGVNVEYMKSECVGNDSGIDKEEIYLKFTNKTSAAVKLNWEFDLTYGERTHNLEGGNPEMIQTIEIPANSSVASGCGVKQDVKMNFLVRFLNIESSTVQLTDFNVKNLSIQ
jgi:hypothetical protein